MAAIPERISQSDISTTVKHIVGGAGSRAHRQREKLAEYLK